MYTREKKLYLSIFSPSTKQERIDNFESYWAFDQAHSGEILEAERNLSIKRDKLQHYQQAPVRSRRALPHPESFYRNYVHLQDDPKTLDRKTLLLTTIYKFARHEWVGISAAWDATLPLAQAKLLTDKISRYHLCEEFCHVRFFHEMFRTCQLEQVEWVPLGKFSQAIYRLFPRIPEKLMAAPAFVTELMGMTFYIHTDRLLDSVFADEPEARDRLRELLHEIMADELAHIGQRRNYLGKLGLKLAAWMARPLYQLFFNDIPEAKQLYDVDAMIRDGLAFDYSSVSEELIERSWIPSYCKA